MTAVYLLVPSTAATAVLDSVFTCCDFGGTQLASQRFGHIFSCNFFSLQLPTVQIDAEDSKYMSKIIMYIICIEFVIM